MAEANRWFDKTRQRFGRTKRAPKGRGSAQADPSQSPGECRLCAKISTFTLLIQNQMKRKSKSDASELCFVVKMTGVTINDALALVHETEHSRLLTIIEDILSFADHTKFAQTDSKLCFQYRSPEEDPQLLDKMIESPLDVASYSAVRLEAYLDCEGQSLSKIDSQRSLVLHYLENICLSILIADPRAANLLGIFERIDGQYVEHTGRKLSFGEIYTEIKELTWPIFKAISFSSVMRWLYSLEGFELAFPRGQVGRAVSSFSKVVSDENSDIGFIWALIGLEALYGRDAGGGKSFQLLRKSEVLLGKRTSHKKSLNKLYDFRSRYLHGDIDIPLHHSHWDAVEGYVQHLESIFSSSALATTVLVCSIQELVERGLHKLEFELRVIE